MYKTKFSTRLLGLLVGLLIVCVSSMGGWRSTPLAHADTTTNVQVNFSSQLGAPDYNGSGFLYGLSQDGSQPAGNLLSTLHPQLFCGGGGGDQPGGWGERALS